MWEVWEVPNKNVETLQDVLFKLAKAHAVVQRQQWPEGFAVFSPERFGADPMVSELFLSPVASELAKHLSESGFTRKGFERSIPRPYALMVANQDDQNPLIRHAIEHVGLRGMRDTDWDR